jgi:hypothetical protein
MAQPLSYKLSHVKQLDFLDVYYGPFVEVKIATSVPESKEAEMENIKNMLILLGRTKQESEKMVERVYDPSRVLDAGKKRLYRDSIRKNTQKSYELLVKYL